MSEPAPRAPTTRGWLAALWALTGVALLFVDAILQLGSRGMRVVRAGLSGPEWLVLVLLTGVFVYGEGVQALQRRWAPHVIRRIAALRAERRRALQVLAPLYALSLIGAPARTLVRAWAGIAAIVLAVLIVRALPNPWRGMIDIAVALALVWGLGAILVQARAGLGSGREAGAQPR
ncbi:MAG TPA: hypothetical protein VK939_05435 [Longimicrobiales bacterium]|nr:hypothetical protein [Longimicrobiales bacterium]